MDYTSLITKQLEMQDLSPAGIPGGVSFVLRNKRYNVLVLDSLADSLGEAELDYDMNAGKWEINEPDPDIAGLMSSIKLEAFINKTWGRYGAPRVVAVPKNQFLQDDVRYDKAKFKDAYYDVAQYLIFRFYATKRISYIQVGGHGFYHMDKDAAVLGTQPFNIGVRAKIYLDRQSTMPLNNYGFAASLKVIRKPMKSDFDLAMNADFIQRLQ